MITSFRGDYFFLSNFSYSLVKLDDLDFENIETAYQASKTLDPLTRRIIWNTADNPTKAKRLGKLLVLRPDWETVKLPIMLDLLKQKFSQCEFERQLKNTGTQMLIEGNNWGDRYWGAELVHGEWVGRNWLGKMLMQIRGTL